MKKILFNQSGSKFVRATPGTNIVMAPYKKEEIMDKKGDFRLYKLQNASKWQNQDEIAQWLAEYGKNPTFIQEDGYNPYLNVDQFGNIAMSGANHGRQNYYDADEIYGVKYNPSEQWYEQYDKDGNLVDYDYGSYTENVKDVLSNLVKSGRNDFLSWHEDLPDGGYVVKGRLPMMFNRTFIRVLNPDIDYDKPKKQKPTNSNKAQKGKTGPEYLSVCYDDATPFQKGAAFFRGELNPLNPPRLIRVKK